LNIVLNKKSLELKAFLKWLFRIAINQVNILPLNYWYAKIKRN